MTLPRASDDAAAMAARYRAHDLLRVDPSLTFGAGQPAWVAAALARAPWVVVRRAPARAGYVAIGVRGHARHERYGGWMRASDVLAHRSPEALAPCLHVVPGADSTDASHRERHLVREGIPALALACALAPLFTQTSVIWGPTGSVGFELASGVATAHAHSDLDLLIRCDERLPIARAQDIARQLDGRRQAQGGCRIDVILETPHGAVSLLEYASARDGGQVLIRGDRAARLVSDPWGVDDGDAVQKG